MEGWFLRAVLLCKQFHSLLLVPRYSSVGDVGVVVIVWTLEQSKDFDVLLLSTDSLLVQCTKYQGGNSSSCSDRKYCQ